MIILSFKRMCFLAFIILIVTQVSFAQERPKVFFSDDFYLESGPPAYIWFYNQKGVLEKLHAVGDEGTINIMRSFAKNCECTVVKEPDDADYVVLVSRHDIVYQPKLAEKKFIVIKVDGEKLVAKGSVRRASNIASNSCKAVLTDWNSTSGEAAHNTSFNLMPR